MITIMPVRDLVDLELSVQGLDGKPPGVSLPDAIPYAYVEIGADGFDGKDATVGINFHVNRSWIKENNIDEGTILLNRYDGEWIRLQTDKIDEDGEFSSFTAETTEFSYFVITGERLESPGLEGSSIEADRSDTETSEPTLITGGTGSTPAQPESLSWSYVLVAVIGTILVCGVISLAISKRRR
jgi:PGF-pre-PGF domain-containing protein